MKYHRLLRKVVSLQRSKGLIPAGSSLLIAFSGGVDSVALALCMLELRDFLKLKRLALAHINHGIRGEEAERDESFCRDFAKDKAIEIFVERLKISPKSSNLEAKARELRYKSLYRIKERGNFDLIATAHHLNDLVETALLWITRGSGREGLLGFEEREGAVIRPLYLARREEVEDFVRIRGEAWVEDSTNHNLDVPRNLIRHRVIPELKKINPRLEDSFLRLRSILKQEEEFLKSLTEEAIRKLLKEGEIDRKAFLKLPEAIKRRVVYHLYGLRNLGEIERTIRSLEKDSHLKSHDA
ncbi:MAG: tRNA lysidine(34) synthetase TilS [Aquificaceae bacterium]|nr:tRNA lysidine(34) synthetase TilS [Aquificaceae bacterium]MCX8163904.1 tRNA lysidine(34) synthetase TilS [Aquificaceae bacterium]